MDDYHIPETDDALLAECDVDTFRAGGPGGQHQNKRACLERLRERLVKLQERPAERRPTRPSRAAKQRRIEQKKRRTRTKRDRADPFPDDEY
jgi:protein subunit release factor B